MFAQLEIARGSLQPLQTSEQTPALVSSVVLWLLPFFGYGWIVQGQQPNLPLLCFLSICSLIPSGLLPQNVAASVPQTEQDYIAHS